ncbi:hypothetical protein BCR32DRAFT_325255 [Anaeromyces robustus]|uniref:Coth-domain-containing protein n=1 Tax=Anaeromyces robustus TaxID=1754192 RepID=A0A1Y1XJH9_9FUNG|nr:hypothetical protein BCR32DRAFT_325255 [Anaeromyces robustus]|eukprot:ORX85862.1 hypothetical protein BCR32DRAFT_325255 [Anaeromyces robustus]
MNIKLFSIFLSSFLAFSNAKIYSFNVVTIFGEGTNIGVKYNDNQYLQLQPTLFPLYSGTVSADNIDKYKFVVMNENGDVVEEEEIERTYNDNSSKVHEVYNRATKEVKITDLPKSFDSNYDIDGSDKYKPLPVNEIYNVYCQCDGVYDSVKDLPFLNENNDRNDDTSMCTINIVTPTETFQTTGKLRISGFGSRFYKKLSWVIKFDEKFKGRKSLKARALANDPTLLRERLATDLYTAVGVPVQVGTYARLFINNDVWGLYYLVDTLSKKWLTNYIHNGDKTKIGTNYKLASNHPTGPYADLKYLGEDVQQYIDTHAYEIDESDADDKEALEYGEHGFYRLIEFTKLFDDWVKKYKDDNSDESVKALEKFFDLETTLRMMVVEALSLARDNFWLVISNVALYYNREKENYLFLPFDFDESMRGTQGEYLKDDYLQDCITWADNVPNFDHYFTKSLFQNEKIVSRYKVILAKTIRDSFNLDTVTPYLNSLVELIKDDVQWNFNATETLSTAYEGTLNHYTFQNFEENLESTAVMYQEPLIYTDTPYGLKQYVDLRSGNCKAFTADVKIPSGSISHQPSFKFILLAQLLSFSFFIFQFFF